MKCYITCSFAGFISLDENCTLLDYELFPREKQKERLIKIAAGVIAKEEESILKRMVKKCDSIIIETIIHIQDIKILKKVLNLNMKPQIWLENF